MQKEDILTGKCCPSRGLAAEYRGDFVRECGILGHHLQKLYTARYQLTNQWPVMSETHSAI